MKDTWQLQDAKNRFSELVERTLKDGAQVVTRHGRKAVVVLAYDEYERLTRPAQNLAQFLLQSPLAGSELEIQRDRGLPGAIEFEP